ncbi:MAG: hypothetical protein AB9922_10305 [Bacteroidales bacterium]
MKANIILIFCIISICSFLFYCCNHEREQERIIRKELSNFLGLEINHDKLELLPINNDENQNIETLFRKKYKIYQFIDEISCTECKINSLKLWSDMINKFSTINSDVIIVIETKNISEIKNMIRKMGLTILYFIDFKQNFKNHNKCLPQSEVLRTFLTRNDTVILAGNILKNRNLEELYYNQIHKN